MKYKYYNSKKLLNLHFQKFIGNYIYIIRKYEKYKRITLLQGKCSLFNFKGTYEVISILLN